MANIEGMKLIPPHNRFKGREGKAPSVYQSCSGCGKHER
jgi:hypothetical protein